MSVREYICLGVIVAMLLCSVASPLLSAYDPYTIDLDSLREPPSARHWMGTDQKGRDIMARVLRGAMLSISVALAAAAISMAIGLMVGLVSGYAGGRVDMAMMALVDLILSFPSLLLAIGISVVLPPGVYTVMIAIAAVGWASFARLIRGHVVTLRQAPFVDAARAMGASPLRILTVHLLPQCMPLALVMMGLKLGGYIITEASLSFLGLGAQPPTASWGSMVSAGRAYILGAPWMSLFPGLAIAMAALSFNVLGDALSDRFSLRRMD